MMDHYDVARAIAYLYPDSEWGYDGDGSSLGPVEDENGALVSRGLEWHDPNTPPPTMAQLEKALPDLPAPPQPLDDQLAEALAALPADEPITGSQLASVIGLLKGNASTATVAKQRTAKKKG